MPKFLVVASEKCARECFEIYGWSKTNKRDPFSIELGNGKYIEGITITENQYLKDFPELDIPICKDHIKAIFKDKSLEYII